MDQSSMYSSGHVNEQKIGWSSSPLGHSYRTFEAEYRAKNIGTVGQSHGKRAAAQLASSRVIWFIERCRQLELECKQLRSSNEEKDKKLKRHDRDVSDLRKLINELCDKVRDLKKTTKAAKKEAEALRVDNVEVRAKLKISIEELNRRKKSDDRLHGALVKSSRENQDLKLDLENMKHVKDGLEEKIKEMKKHSEEELDAQRQDFQIRLDASNKRAEDALQELKDKTGGWDQPSLRMLLWKNKASLYILPPEFNVRSKKLLEKVKNNKTIFGEDHMMPRIYHMHINEDIYKSKKTKKISLSKIVNIAIKKAYNIIY